MHPQLEAFTEVVRRGSVTGAARALFLTQPALTARLNALERDVGAPLLVRRRGGGRPNEAGRTLLPLPRRGPPAGRGRGRARVPGAGPPSPPRAGRPWGGVAGGRIVPPERKGGAAGYVSICASP